MNKEFKVKEWLIDKAQDTARRYNCFIDYSRRTDDVEARPLVEDGYVYVMGTVEDETEKALKIRLTTGDVVGSYKGWSTWLPKSQIVAL